MIKESPGDRILRIFRDAGATDEDLELVRKGIRLWMEGKVNGKELYYYLMGLAWEKIIPLTPREVGDIREALGLPRSTKSLN